MHREIRTDTVSTLIVFLSLATSNITLIVCIFACASTDTILLDYRWLDGLRDLNHSKDVLLRSQSWRVGSSDRPRALRLGIDPINHSYYNMIWVFLEHQRHH